MHGSEEDHARRLDGQHQDVDRTPSGRVNQNDRGQTEINGESTSMVWPTVGSRTAKEQNRQTETDRQTGTPSHRIQRAVGPTYKSRNGKKTFFSNSRNHPEITCSYSYTQGEMTSQNLR